MIVFLVIAVYMVVMFGIGLIFRKKSQTAEGFYLSGRGLPWPVVMLTFAATWIGASSTMAKSGLAYSTGWAALTPTFATIFAFLVFTFVSPRIRRIGVKHGVTSIPDLHKRRFGNGPALVAGLIIAWTMVGTIGTQMVATAGILQLIFEPYGGMAYEVALVVSLIVVVAYTMMSGFYGVAYTDVVQGLLLLVTIGVALPLVALNLSGGYGNLTATLPADYFSLKPDSTLLGYSWVYLLYFLAGPPYWQRSFASDSERSARWGVFGGNVIILVYSAAVTLVGICAAVIYPSWPEALSAEMLIPTMMRDFFPPIVYAIVLVALISVLMSTIDSYLIIAAQTISDDVYKIFRPNSTDASRLKGAKWVIVLLGVASVIFAMNFREILEALVFAYAFFSSAIAIPTLAALFWKRATAAGILSGMLGGFGVSCVWTWLLNNPFGLHEAIPGGLTSLALVVIVSLATAKRGKPTPFLS